MGGPMTDEMLAMIRRTWDGVDSSASKLTVTNTRTPGQLLHALSCAPRDVPRLLAEVERLTVLESGQRKAWANAGRERDRARQDAADAQAALQGAHADAEAAAGNAVYWRRRADRLRGAWESARRGRRQERAQRVEREIERDDALAEFDAERESNDALRKNRDQLHDELLAAREELVRVRSEADELRGGWRAADRNRQRLREQRDKANNNARDSRAELDKAREQLEFVRSFAERIARSADAAYVNAGQVLLDIVGPVTVAGGTPLAMQACPHRDFDDPTRCLICHP